MYEGDGEGLEYDEDEYEGDDLELLPNHPPPLLPLELLPREEEPREPPLEPKIYCIRNFSKW